MFGLEEWIFDQDFTRDLLLKHFGTNNLKGFGIEEMVAATCAAGAIMHYLGETNHLKLQHLNVISALQQSNHVWLDNFTIRNLELLHSPHEKAITLFNILDRATTPMGSRLLRRWIAMPLKDISAINNRLEVVDYFQKFNELSDAIHQQLKEIGDLERLTAKLATARIIPREVVQIKRSLEASNEIKKILANSQNAALKNISDQLNPCETLIAEIEKQIKEDAPVSVNKGMVFNEGVNADLDELRSMAYSGKDYLVNMQIRESERTGITSLKVGFNNVFGYFIEVTNSHKSKVPEEWIRKQTLTNAERYITEELKEYETKILGAEEKILALEVSMYGKFVQWLTEFIGPLQNNAKLLAQLDCLASFATVSKENNYKRPEVNDGKSIVILEGRHPVIEKALPVGENYVSNDLYLDEDSQQILVITGPNMSGKSALLRQTAIIVLMAQMGCFVPAKEARIGAVDKIFTRVGASDNLSQGESTFMVEMNETASILNNLSEKSLILLDEIGRGTSTYDGISIAWSIAEYLQNIVCHPLSRTQ